MGAVEIIVTLYALAGIAFIAGLVYLIRRRIRIRKKETFEKRDN